MSTFHEKLISASRKNTSLLCVGLDPDPALMPVKNVVEFNRAIIEATADLVCCYKPNLAFYESMGYPGLETLKLTLEHIPNDIPVIGDAKRGDIGSTAQAYASAMFQQWGFDALTVNPYLGMDALDPFFEYADKGVLVLCHTSNPGAADFQELLVEQEGEYRPLYEYVALKASAWNRHGNVGLVMGATYPQQMQKVREICPDMLILAPGIGTQGGDLENTVKYGVNTNGEGLIINSSRSIIFASKDSADYAEKAKLAAQELRDSINRARSEIML